ncbi:MAG: OsmC family protein [Gluconacetobacter sp.]
MTIKKFGTAHWEGSIKEGKGTVSTESGALSAQPYGFNTRFEGVAGTNPEELIGASHAACFAMALSGILGGAGLTATALDTKSVISLEKQAEGFAVTAAHLTLTATIPGITEDQFQELAAKAKAGCPISKLLKAEITLEARVKA